MHTEVVEEVRDGLDVGMHVSHVAQSNQLDVLAFVDLLAFHPLVEGHLLPAGVLQRIRG